MIPCVRKVILPFYSLLVCAGILKLNPGLGIAGKKGNSSQENSVNGHQSRNMWGNIKKGVVWDVREQEGKIGWHLFN